MPEIFCQLRKADEITGIVSGVMTSSAVVDGDKEVPNFPDTVKAVQDWATSQYRASRGKSWGNCRLMHTDRVIGHLVSPPEINSAKKEIRIAAQITDPKILQDTLAGDYVGFSLGGAYVDRKSLGGGITEFSPRVGEVSLVDRPSCPVALIDSIKSETFTLTKRDGSRVQRHFAQPTLEKWKRRDLSHLLLAEVARQLRKSGGVCFAPGTNRRRASAGTGIALQGHTQPRENPNQKFTRTRGLL